ncbi:MAG: hypothetical protein G01um101425_782 [Candidatus Peregrinibacteria bacterium Gr01-1014_25]|nr:MAG: hypothetical protein G01um101425_782 [Candidatus Peregrinibacteria bacterium Gr01-1014_25]
MMLPPRIVTALSLAALAAGVFGVVSLGLARHARLRAETAATMLQENFRSDQRTGRDRFLALPPDLQDVVTSSHDTLVKAGLSDAFLTEHVALADVGGQPGGRTVTWHALLGDIRMVLEDRIWFAVGIGRVHSLAAQLGRAHDITPLFSSAEAGRVLEKCIGVFTDPAFSLRAAVPDGPVRFLLQARAVEVLDEHAVVGTLDMETGECQKRVL